MSTRSLGRSSLLACLALLGATSVAAAQSSSTSIVFVSDGVPDAALLAREVLPGHEVVVLHEGSDALDQISAALASHHALRSIAIVSHGAPGALQVGSARLGRAELADRQADVRAWRDALAPDADILLYGCDVGRGAEGEAFVSELAQLTAADVAASTDPTGGALDGDWALERRIGHVTAVAPWPTAVMTRWRYRMVTVTEPPDMANAIPGTATVLTVGSNTFSGGLATPGDRQDNFQITVPAGATLTAASLTLDRSGGFVGSVTFNLSEVRMTSGSFTSGFPFGPGTYQVQVITDFSVGNAWSMSFTVAGPAPVCGNGVPEAGEACDDGNATQCDGCSNACAVVLNGCFIGGVCIADGAVNPANQCTACRRTVSRTVYSPVVSGTVCNDGQFCTTGETCNGAGVCSGPARNCADALGCTTDSCNETSDACAHAVTTGCLIGGACVATGTLDPANACRTCAPTASSSAYTPTALGSACDDAQFCTVTDACDGSGACGGAPRDCADALACTTDACDETADACTNALASGCLIGGACVDAGTLDPANGCRVCTPSTLTSDYTDAPSGTACDDALLCTTSDACDGAGACTGGALDCDDGLACTTDACDEATGACTTTTVPDCGDAGVDGGDRDAGSALDGGMTSGDAGPAVDGGRTDGGVLPADGSRSDGGARVDAGDGTVVTSGGCGCRVGNGGRVPAAVWAGLVMAMGIVARRARRRR